MDRQRKKTRAITRLCCALLVMVLILTNGSLGAKVSADTTQESTRMNVMLIIDGSASLDWQYDPTDPDGYRFDAIDLFLALLTDQDNNVGTLVFHGSADEFQLDLEMAALNGKSAKLALSDKIRKVQTDNGTNLGAALLRGVEEAASMSAQNGLDSVVILFSDGKTEVSGGDEAMNAALKAKEDATVLAQDNNIPVYTICLAATDRADPGELEEIATRTSGEFVQVKNAKALSSAFEAFYRMIFGTSGTEIREVTFPEEGTIQIPFTIPTYGAEEANVILDTNGLQEVAITTPNGDMTAAQLEAATMSGGYYDVIKLVDPPSGDYYVNLTGIPQNSVTVNVLFNIDSAAALQTLDGKHDYSIGEEVVFQANLIQNGAPIKDPAVTDEYTAVLTLVDSATGEPEDFVMTSDGMGTFTYATKSQSSSSYKAYVTMSCADLTLVTNEWKVNFDNTPPVVNTDTVEVKKFVWRPFFGRTNSLDLSGYFSDAQDKQLRYEVVSSQLVKNTWTLDETTGKLDVDIARSKSGAVVVEARDTQGASAQVTVNYKITDLTYFINGSALLMFIVGGSIAACILVEIGKRTWQGELEVRNMGNGVRRNYGDFRGILKLSKLGIGTCGLDGSFKALPRNQMVFIPKKMVYTTSAREGTKKPISIVGGNVKIYADATMTKGIEVIAKPRMIRNSTFGGGAPARKGPASRKSGPF